MATNYQSPDKAHDLFFKQAMSEKQVAREFFESHLPGNLLAVINLNTLELQPGSFIDDHRKETIADMLFRADIEGKEAYLYLLVEHQSKPDKLMPFRILRYTYNIISKHLNDTKDDKIPLVYPLVVYHGTTPWRYSTDIKTLVDAPRELVDTYFLKPFSLIDLNRIEDDLLKDKVWSGVMGLTLKHILARNIEYYFKDILDLIKKINESEPYQSKEFIKNVLVYIVDRGDLVNKKAFFDSITTELSPELGEKIMTIAEQLRAEGRQEGRNQRDLEIIERMLSANMEFSLIEKITGLSSAKIQEIIEQH